MQSPHKTAVSLALAAALAATALPGAEGAEAAHGACVAPDVAGVSLADARRALEASGCGVKVRQLPAHGRFVTPASADGRQLVARQRPRAGARSRAVTVWVKPLCSQPALPGPARQGPKTRRGPAELIAGLFLVGGPRRTSPHCRAALPEAGTVTVSTQAGKLVARRTVRSGHFAIFPLAPGGYVLDGVLASRPGATPVAFPRTAFTIASRRTTLLNLVESVR